MRFKPKRLSLNLLLSFASLLSFFFIGEIVFRVFLPQQPASTFVQTDKKVNYIHQPRIEAFQWSNGEKIGININSHSLRYPDELASPKPQNEFRVLVLGDSFTFGWKIEYEDTFLRLLESHYEGKSKKQIRFLNAGHGGYSTQNQALFLKYYGLTMDPDLILVMMGPNDVEENRGMRLYELDAQGQLKERGANWGAMTWLKHSVNLIPFYRQAVAHSHFLYFVRKKGVLAMTRIYNRKFFQKAQNFEDKLQQKKVELTQMTSPVLPQAPKQPRASQAKKELSPDPAWHYLLSLTRLVFLEMKALADSHHIPLVVSTVGYSEPLTANFLAQSKGWWKKYGIEFIETEKDFGTLVDLSRGDYLIPNDYHYNAEGHMALYLILKEKLNPFLPLS